MVKRRCRWRLKNVEDPRTCVAPSSVSLSSNCHAGLQSQELAVLLFLPLCSSFASSFIFRNPKCLEFGHGNCNPKGSGDMVVSCADDDLCTLRSMYCYSQIFYAHNGPAAAMYCKEHLLNNVMNAIPSGPLTREEWLAALPRVMVAGFVKTDSDFQKHGR